MTGRGNQKDPKTENQTTFLSKDLEEAVHSNDLILRILDARKYWLRILGKFCCAFWWSLTGSSEYFFHLLLCE